MKRKIIALCLIVAMLGVAVVGSTLAYFTDTAEATNVFTVGKIDIELEEETAVLDKKGGKEIEGKLIETEDGAAYTNIMPTNYLKKEVTVTNLENPAYVRITVIHNNYTKVNSAIDDVYEPGAKEGATWETYQADYNSVFDGWNIDVDAHLDANGKRYDTKYKMDKEAFVLEDGVTLLAIDMSYIPSAAADNGIFSVDNWFKSEAEAKSADWSMDKSEGGYAAGYYTSALNPAERVYVYYLKMDKGTSFKVFDGLSCPADFNQAQAEMFQNLKIEVYVDAIQTESFEADAKKAFEALEIAHPLKTLRSASSAVIVTSDEELATAIAAGETDLVLSAGTYHMPTAAKGKTLTISGTHEAVIEVVPAGAGEAGGQLDYSLDGSTVTFNGVTIKTNSKLYAGYARLSAVYNDCVIQNTYNLGVGTSEFNNCTFNITNEYLRVAGAHSATFNGCTFNTDGRAILVYQDGTNVAQTVTVKDCTFNATAAAQTWNGIHVAAVSIDGTNGTYVVNLVGNNTVDSDFNGLWQIKTGEANVTVNE